MSKKFYETPEFKELSKEWEEILEQSGLGIVRNTSESKAWWRAKDGDPWVETKGLYFHALQECVSRACFDSSFDRVIMVMRAEGAKVIEICRHLLELGISKSQTKNPWNITRPVRLTIRKYEARWGVRNWSPDQLRQKVYSKRRTR